MGAGGRQGGKEVTMDRAKGRGLLLAGVLAGLAGCGWIESGGGLREIDGVVTMDGVALPHERWVLLDVPAGTSSLELSSGTGDMALAGSTDGTTRVELLLCSELEDDGSVELQGGRLVARSASGRKVAVNGARGTLGTGFGLLLKTGTGGVSLSALHGLQRVEVDSGTGDVALTASQAQDVRIDSGTGAVSLRDTAARDVWVNTGTGPVDLAGCTVAGLEIETGTSDVRLRDCHATRTQVTSGTGSVRLEGQNELGSTSYDLGTGKVIGS